MNKAERKTNTIPASVYGTIAYYKYNGNKMRRVIVRIRFPRRSDNCSGFVFLSVFDGHEQRFHQLRREAN